MTPQKKQKGILREATISLLTGGIGYFLLVLLLFITLPMLMFIIAITPLTMPWLSVIEILMYVSLITYAFIRILRRTRQDVEKLPVVIRDEIHDLIDWVVGNEG